MRIQIDSYQVNTSPEGTVITTPTDGPLLKSLWHETTVQAAFNGSDLILSHKGFEVVLKTFPKAKLVKNVPLYFAGLSASGKVTISCQAALA